MKTQRCPRSAAHTPPRRWRNTRNRRPETCTTTTTTTHPPRPSPRPPLLDSITHHDHHPSPRLLHSITHHDHHLDVRPTTQRNDEPGRERERERERTDEEEEKEKKKKQNQTLKHFQSKHERQDLRKTTNKNQILLPLCSTLRNTTLTQTPNQEDTTSVHHAITPPTSPHAHTITHIAHHTTITSSSYSLIITHHQPIIIISHTITLSSSSPHRPRILPPHHHHHHRHPRIPLIHHFRHGFF